MAGFLEPYKAQGQGNPGAGGTLRSGVVLRVFAGVGAASPCAGRADCALHSRHRDGRRGLLQRQSPAGHVAADGDRWKTGSYPGTVCIVSGRSGRRAFFRNLHPARTAGQQIPLEPQQQGCLSAGGVSGRLPCVGRQPWRAVRTVPAAWAVERHTAALAAEAAGRHGGRHAAGGQEPT